MIPSAEWFVIKSGPNEGTIHMAGWSYSAHLGNPTGRTDDGWLAWATCPRCAAMVLSGDSASVISREIAAHEAWHSSTDYWIPPEVTAEQDRVYRRLSKA